MVQLSYRTYNSYNWSSIGPFHGKSSQVDKNKLSNSAMKTSIYIISEDTSIFAPQRLRF